MESQNVALHAHTYSVSTETYENTPGLKESMKIIQTDVWVRPSDGEEIEFISAMEGKDYPIFLTMYHPEY